MRLVFILITLFSTIHIEIASGCSFSPDTPENKLVSISYSLKSALQSKETALFFGILKSFKSKKIARSLDSYEENINFLWKGKAKDSLLTECEYVFEVTKDLKDSSRGKSFKVAQSLWSRRTKSCESYEYDNLGLFLEEIHPCPEVGRPYYAHSGNSGSVDIDKERLYIYSERYGITEVHYRKFAIFANSDSDLKKKSNFEKNLLAVIDNISNPPSVEEVSCFKSANSLPPEYYYFSQILGLKEFKKLQTDLKLKKDKKDFANIQKCQSYYTEQRNRSIMKIANRLDISF